MKNYLSGQDPEERERVITATPGKPELAIADSAAKAFVPPQGVDVLEEIYVDGEIDVPAAKIRWGTKPKPKWPITAASHAFSGKDGAEKVAGDARVEMRRIRHTPSFGGKRYSDHHLSWLIRVGFCPSPGGARAPLNRAAACPVMAISRW